MIRKNKRVINKILIIFIFVSFLFIILVKLNYKNNIEKIENLDNYKYILVNKENKLSKDFKPDNLVEVIKCSEKKFYLEKEAHNAYHQMCLDSKKEGLNILITSAVLAPNALNVPISFLQYEMDNAIKLENNKNVNNTNTKLIIKIYFASPLYAVITLDILFALSIL